MLIVLSSFLMLQPMYRAIVPMLKHGHWLSPSLPSPYPQSDAYDSYSINYKYRCHNPSYIPTEVESMQIFEHINRLHLTLCNLKFLMNCLFRIKHTFCTLVCVFTYLYICDKKRIMVPSYLPIRPSVRMSVLDSHWTVLKVPMTLGPSMRPSG